MDSIKVYETLDKGSTPFWDTIDRNSNFIKIFILENIIILSSISRNGRVVYGTCLENRRSGDRPVGSNPTSGAIYPGVSQW